MRGDCVGIEGEAPGQVLVKVRGGIQYVGLAIRFTNPNSEHTTSGLLPPFSF